MPSIPTPGGLKPEDYRVGVYPTIDGPETPDAYNGPAGQAVGASTDRR